MLAVAISICAFLLGIADVPVAATPASRSAGPDAGAPTSGPGSLAERLLASPSPTATELRALGKNVDLALIDLARSQTTPAATRRAAVAALGRLATKTGFDYLARVVGAAGDARAEQDVSLLRAAAFALAWARAPRTVDLLYPLLAHRNLEIRLDAVAALTASRLPDAIDVLRTYVDAEKDPVTQERARKQLSLLEKNVVRRPPPPPPPPRLIRPKSIHERTDPARPPERGP